LLIIIAAMYGEKPKKRIDPVTAIHKAQSFCAYRERCQQELRTKLYDWGLFPKEVEQIIGQLISDNFLNEERFAKAFATGKFRIKGWGRNKIKTMLQQFHVTDYCIKKGLAEIDEEEYLEVLKKVIEKKARTVTEKNEFKRKNKIVAYTIGKGFERELVWGMMKNLEK
jgi:regulatory protein